MNLPLVLEVEYPGNVLIEPSKVALTSGHRYGLIGSSGAGKSSLFNKMEQGEIAGWPTPDELKTVRVPQEVSGDSELFQGETIVWKAALSCTVPMDESAPERDEPKRLEKAEAMLKKLGFKKKRREEAIANLSQGWKQRLAMVCAVLSEPDILLLDEPSDALDISGQVQIERLLLEYEDEYQYLITVSHDPAYLKAVCTDILHIEEKHVKHFPGSYDSYLEVMEEKRKAAEQRVQAYEKKKEASLKFIQKQQNNLDKQKQVREKKEKMEERMGAYREDGKRYKTKSLKKLDMSYVRLPEKAQDIKLAQAKDLHFKLEESCQIGGNMPLLQMEDVSLGYGSGEEDGKANILDHITLQIEKTSRIALVGANSSGKSTLMKALVDPSGCGIVKNGSIQANPSLRIGYLAQRQGEELARKFGELTPVEFLCQERHSDFQKPHAARQYLGRFTLSGDVQVTKIKLLSGGQRTKLGVAFACVEKPNLLMCDEPTSGLDMAARAALAEALQAFGGALLVSSHDREFIRDDVTFDEIWITNKGRVSCQRAQMEDEEEQHELFQEYFDEFIGTL